MSTITADEIRKIRGKYGLSQRAFANVLGIGVASIARYEKGAEPSKANANLIHAAANPRFMMECVEREGDALPVALRESVARVYYACVSLSEEDDEVAQAAMAPEAVEAKHMNEVYDLTLRQEVLNEQAANLIGELIAKKISGGIYRPCVSGIR